MSILRPAPRPIVHGLRMAHFCEQLVDAHADCQDPAWSRRDDLWMCEPHRAYWDWAMSHQDDPEGDDPAWHTRQVPEGSVLFQIGNGYSVVIPDA